MAAAPPEPPSAPPRPRMGQAYLDLTFRGRPGGWRYGLGLLLIVVITQLFGGALALAVMGRSVGELVDVLRTGQAPRGLSSRLFLAMNLPSIAFLLAAWLVVVTVHRRSLLTLITPRSRLSLRRLLQGFGVWFVLQALSLVVLYAMDPPGLQLHLDLRRLLPFAALALVLTPLQTSGEELVFRGYLLQALGGLTRRPWLLAGINGGLFMLPHLVNPEMSYGAVPMALSYFTIGMFLALITLRDNRLELALGAHAANNLFDGVFAHTAVSTLPTPSLFTVAQAFPWPSLAVMVTCCAVFYAVVFRRLASSQAGTARGAENMEGITCLSPVPATEGGFAMSLKQKFDLTGRSAIVTGGARGIGQACAEALAEYGVNLLLADVLDDRLQETVADLGQRYGVEVAGVVCDVTDSAAVDRLVAAAVERFGRLDLYVNSVGITLWQESASTTDEQWRQVMDTNLNAAFYQSRAAGRQMLSQGQGSIIHIASMSGSIVNRPQAQTSYNASKAGLMHLVRSLAGEWASRGVRINTISPGYTLSEMTYGAKDYLELWNTMIPMGRMAQPEELVGGLIYLASDASSYTTGHDLVMDGGYTVW